MPQTTLFEKSKPISISNLWQKFIIASALTLIIICYISHENKAYAQNNASGASTGLNGLLPNITQNSNSDLNNSNNLNNSTTLNKNKGEQPNQGFNVFKKDKQLEALVLRYQQTAWAANATKLTEKALVQEYLALEALQNYLTVQQQQKQQRVQALLSTYQALKTQEAFKNLNNKDLGSKVQK